MGVEFTDFKGFTLVDIDFEGFEAQKLGHTITAKFDPSGELKLVS